MTETRKLVIIGSGPAGYTAAIYAARADLEPLVYAGYAWGGQLTLTTEVENFPGFPTGIQGPALMDNFRAQAERFGAELRDRDVTAVDFGRYPFQINSEDETVEAQAVIVATGASALWLGIPGEETYRGFGVSSCAVCDGAFFRDKHVTVVGGGDVAIEDATFLTRFARDVTIIHRRDTLRASKAMQKHALANDKIRFIWNSVVEEVVGEEVPGRGRRVTGLRLRHAISGEVRHWNTDAMFVAIGHRPNTDVFRGRLPLDERGYALTVGGETTATAIPGIFVAGDVRDHRYRQAITAAGEGAKAAIDAEHWLAEHANNDADEGNLVSATDRRGTHYL